MDNYEELLNSIVEDTKQLSSPSTHAMKLDTNDYLTALTLAKDLNAKYSGATFEALRHTPNMYLEIHKY